MHGWDSDKDTEGPGPRRRAKVCRDCRKIILRYDNLVTRRNNLEVYYLCTECAAKEEADAVTG